MEQDDDKKISLLAKVARSTRSSHPGDSKISILALAAASYGARPSDEATVPTGFDPNAVALFEAIVEGAFLDASADGVIDAAERTAFERVVLEACAGVIGQSQISALVADLTDELAEDGVDKRAAAVGAQAGKKRDHALEVLRIAALIAQTSDSVGAEERAVLEKIAVASGLQVADVDHALEDVRAALAAV